MAYEIINCCMYKQILREGGVLKYWEPKKLFSQSFVVKYCVFLVYAFVHYQTLSFMQNCVCLIMDKFNH